MTERHFRRALAEDADLLNELTLAGIRHWGHHERFPDAYEALAMSLPSAEDVEENIVFVLVEDDDVVAFYELVDRGDHIEFLRMFQRVHLIGKGYGRLLWDHAVKEAAAVRNRMLIMSDPEAVGFYQAMGAEVERTTEVSPGFFLGVLWYELT